MAICINDVLDYLDLHPIGCREGGVDSLMEMLHDAYTSYNTIDNDEIHRLFQNMDALLEMLPCNAAERVRSLVSDLCMEHEVLAFSHGIVVGMYLVTEVRTLP